MRTQIAFLLSAFAFVFTAAHPAVFDEAEEKILGLGLGSVISSIFSGNKSTFGYATSGNITTDIAQTITIANFLSGLGNSTGNEMSSAYKELQSIYSQNMVEWRAAIASLKNNTTTPNSVQLTNFLDAFKTQLNKTAKTAAETAVDIAKADIDFKIGLINSAVDIVKADVAFKTGLVNQLVDLFKGNHSTTPTSAQLTDFLDAFKNQINKTGNAAAETASDIVKADMAFKMGVINTAVDIVKADVAFKTGLVNQIADFFKGNHSTTPTSAQLTEFLDAFKNQLNRTANAAVDTAVDIVKADIVLKMSVINTAVDIVKADIAFKTGLINQLVDLFKGNYSTATDSIGAAVDSASSGLESAINSSMGNASSEVKVQLEALLDALKSDNMTLGSGIVAALAELKGQNVTAQALLQQLSGKLTGSLQQAAQTAAGFFGKVGAGLSGAGSAVGGFVGSIGSSIAGGVANLGGALGNISGIGGGAAGSGAIAVGV